MPNSFPKRLHYFAFPPAACGGPHLPTLALAHLSDGSRGGGCEVASHWGLDLHFGDSSLGPESRVCSRTHGTLQPQAVRVGPGTRLGLSGEGRSHSRGRSGFQRKFGMSLAAREMGSVQGAACVSHCRYSLILCLLPPLNSPPFAWNFPGLITEVPHPRNPLVLGNLGQLVTLLAVDQTLSSLGCLQLGSHSWNPRVTSRNPLLHKSPP